MSQSPDEAVADDRADEYRRGWDQLLELLARGGSLSGRERNCCFLNTGKAATDGQVQFTDVSGISGVNFTDDARALAWDDWDHDGDLDLWVVNRTGPQVRFLRNNHQATKSAQSYHYLSLKLRGTDCNHDAIGATVTVVTGGDTVVAQSRTLKAGESYLSQSSKWLHFGLGEHDTIDRVEVRWPNGPRGSSGVQVIGNIEVDGRYLIVQGEVRPQKLTSQLSVQKVLPDKGDERRAAAESNPNRVVVFGRLPMPPIAVKDSAGASRLANPPIDRPKLINLWASWCAPCIAELKEWGEASGRLDSAGVDMVLLSTDQLGGQAASPDASEKLITRLELPFEWSFLTAEGADAIDSCLAMVQRDYRRAMGVPMSLLLDRHGQLAAIYRGPVNVDTLIDDVEALDRTPEQVRTSLSPIVGNWLHPPRRASAVDFAVALQRTRTGGAAEQYLRHVLDLVEQQTDGPYAITAQTAGRSAFALGSMMLEQVRLNEAVNFSRQAAELLPRDSRPLVNLGAALTQLNRLREALIPLNAALKLDPGKTSVLINRGNILNRLGKHSLAVTDWEAALQRSPDDETVRQQVASLAYALGDDARAVRHYRDLLRRHPKSLDFAGVLAWILATSPDEQIRDGAEALELSARWASGADPSDPKPLNALAAALAAQGQFDEAVATAEHAVELAEALGNEAIVRVYRERLKRYQQGEPFLRKPIPSGN